MKEGVNKKKILTSPLIFFFNYFSICISINSECSKTYDFERRKKNKRNPFKIHMFKTCPLNVVFFTHSLTIGIVHHITSSLFNRIFHSVFSYSSHISPPHWYSRLCMICTIHCNIFLFTILLSLKKSKTKEKTVKKFPTNKSWLKLSLFCIIILW